MLSIVPRRRAGATGLEWSAAQMDIGRAAGTVGVMPTTNDALMPAVAAIGAVAATRWAVVYLELPVWAGVPAAAGGVAAGAAFTCLMVLAVSGWRHESADGEVVTGWAAQRQHLSEILEPVRDGTSPQ